MSITYEDAQRKYEQALARHKDALDTDKPVEHRWAAYGDWNYWLGWMEGYEAAKAGQETE